MGLSVAQRAMRQADGRFGTVDRRPGELTPRQAEVLSRIAAGLTYKEVAAELGVSPLTVRNLLAQAYGRLDVHTRAEATLTAIRLGLVAP